MTRQRTIVGFGAAYLAEHPDRTEPGGLAAEVALAACRLHHRGVMISRVGQDPPGDELLSQLRAAGVDTEHVQSDPDLPTARLLIRGTGAPAASALSAPAAFDNVNWDFDLEDVSQQADAVIFDHLAQREGQTRSVLTRLLEECRVAIRLYDVTCRHEREIDRVRVASTLQYADGVVIDEPALRVLAPAGSIAESARKLLRSSDLTVVMTVADNRAASIHTAAASPSNAPYYQSQVHHVFVVGMIHGMLRGWDSPQCTAVASAIADFAATHGGEHVPEELVEPRE